MSAPFFYQQEVPNIGYSILSEETSKHCIQVLRMKVGEPLQLTDGKGSLISAIITKEDKRHCEIKVLERTFEEKKGRKVSIGISLLKNVNRLEWFLEKVTELGVSEVIPLLCQRTEKQQFRFDRMQNILISAMLQSKQVWLPILHEPSPIEKIIISSTIEQKLIAHCEEATKTSLKDLQLQESLQILIGPEGDFSPKEIELALLNNYAPVSLGNTRLRTETAGVVAASLLINL